MDTDNASPKFNVGDRVRYYDEPGTVIQAGIAPVVRFDNWTDYDGMQIAHYSLKRIPHPTPEPWRLLFRAHRDGWELLHCLRSDNFKYRSWCNDTTGDRFTLDTKRPVR